MYYQQLNHSHHQYHHNLKYMITAFTITVALMLSTTIYGIGNAYATNPLTQKQEFDITVKNIQHKNIILAVTVDGLNQKFTIKGNPSRIGAPTTQIIKLTFSRNNGAIPPTPLPIKLGDEYTYCVSFKNSQSSCQRASIDTLTQPETKTLDAKYIP